MREVIDTDWGEGAVRYLGRGRSVVIPGGREVADEWQALQVATMSKAVGFFSALGLDLEEGKIFIGRFGRSGRILLTPAPGGIRKAGRTPVFVGQLGQDGALRGRMRIRYLTQVVLLVQPLFLYSVMTGLGLGWGMSLVIAAVASLLDSLLALRQTRTDAAAFAAVLGRTLTGQSHPLTDAGLDTMPES